MRVYHLLAADNALSDITHHRLRVSRFADLNDPFELLAAKANQERFRKALRSWRDHFSGINGLLCFSRNWRNPVLWSHYAAKHRGMCLGFDIASSLLTPVRYTRRRRTVRFADHDPEKGLDEWFVQDLLRTKYRHWRYEDEVRVLVKLDPKKFEDGSYFYPFGEGLMLRTVILGPLCESSDTGIKELVSSTYQRVTVVKARLAFNSFEVVTDRRSLPHHG